MGYDSKLATTSYQDGGDAAKGTPRACDSTAESNGILESLHVVTILMLTLFCRAGAQTNAIDRVGCQARIKDIVKRGKVLEYPNYWTFITQRWALQAEPVLTSPILHDVTVSSKCYIVHGPWHSGKTTLLNALDDSLHYTHRGEGIETSMRGKWPPLYSKKGNKTMDRIRTRRASSLVSFRRPRK